jgi:hypothetical protein
MVLGATAFLLSPAISSPSSSLPSERNSAPARCMSGLPECRQPLHSYRIRTLLAEILLGITLASHP